MIIKNDTTDTTTTTATGSSNKINSETPSQNRHKGKEKPDEKRYTMSTMNNVDDQKKRF
jgi:hypothetical protein